MTTTVELPTKLLSKQVVDMMQNGGGEVRERARVAAGLIESRIRKAYNHDGPLLVAVSVVEGYASDFCATVDRCWAEYNEQRTA